MHVQDICLLSETCQKVLLPIYEISKCVTILMVAPRSHMSYGYPFAYHAIDDVCTENHQLDMIKMQGQSVSVNQLQTFFTSGQGGTHTHSRSLACILPCKAFISLGWSGVSACSCACVQVERAVMDPPQQADAIQLPPVGDRQCGKRRRMSRCNADAHSSKR